MSTENDVVQPSDQLSRREFLKTALLGAAGLAGTALLGRTSGLALAHDAPRTMPTVPAAAAATKAATSRDLHTPKGARVTPRRPPGFAMDPMTFLTHFDYGTVSKSATGRTVREYRLVAGDHTVEVAPGIEMACWLYNRMLPGPTLRCTQGDLVRVHFVNAASHHHTIHFHGIHPGNMDGVFEMVPPGGTFVYEFVAEPFGVHVYHCHVPPLDKHIAKGLFGTFIVDPPQGRPEAREMVMVMHGLDVDFDGENELYAVNGYANYYRDYPIRLSVGEPVRIYLSNLTEFDLINSFHLHGDFFRFYRTGTDLERYEFTDTVMLCQGERGVMELAYKHPGLFMFHAHQSEFTQLGWMGLFDVRG